MVYKYREVRGTFTALTPDTTDADEHPNIVPLTGSVVLTPIYKDGGISFSESGHFDQPQPKPAAIDPDGILRSVVTDPVTGAISRQPLFLPVTVDERANQEWTYEASFPEVVRTDTGERVNIPTKQFAVEPGDGPLNLVAVATTRHPGLAITKGAPGAGLQEITAADGEIVFSWDNGLSTTIPMPKAAPGPRGPKGDPGDVRFEGIDPSITVRTDDVLIGDTSVAATTYVDEGRWMAGTIAASEDLNNRTTPGIAPTFTVANSVANKPSWASGNPFSIETWVGSGSSDPVQYQRFTQGDAAGLRAALRYRHGGVWRDWVDMIPDRSGPWYKGSITSSHVLDNLETGLYYVFAVNTAAVLGFPEGTQGGPVQIVRQGASGGFMLLQTATTPVKMWTRVRTGSGWSSPALLNPEPEPAPEPDHSALQHDLLVEDFTRRRGGLRWTTVGCVALRFDHGLDKFNRLIRPHMERLNLPYSLALNSRDWGKAENDGVTASMVDEWVQGGLAEIWNHGAVHTGSKVESEWTDIIVSGRDELAAQIPSATIDGFVIPGTGGTGYGDFITGASRGEFSDTPAGRLLLASHAIVTGAIPSSADIPLDGRIRTGINHIGFGSTTLSSFQSAVNSVASRTVGRVLMMHPSQIDTSGYDTEAEFAAKLEWLAGERDAGRVKVVGHYDLHLCMRAPDM